MPAPDTLATILRSEAEPFGLLLEPEEAGWRQTRIWCPYCGRRRQIGWLESRDGIGYLRTRCPSCSLIYGDINNSSGLKELYDLRSFKPALNRVVSVMRSYMPQALAQGVYPCRACGKLALVRITQPGEPYHSVPHPHPHRSLVLECSSCGEVNATWACSPAYWSHPEVSAFDTQHPQAIIGPEAELEYENRRAIRFSLIDIVSNEKLVAITDYYTLAVLAISHE